GPPDGASAKLHREGKLSLGPAELHARLEERLEMKAPPVTNDWKGWDPIRRRARPGSLDAQTFGMLRGIEEKKYAPPTATQAAPLVGRREDRVWLPLRRALEHCPRTARIVGTIDRVGVRLEVGVKHRHVRPLFQGRVSGDLVDVGHELDALRLRARVERRNVD